MSTFRWSTQASFGSAANSFPSHGQLSSFPAAAQEIKVGGIFDLTGITSDVGKPFAQGVRDGVAWLNKNGGVNGKKIRLIDSDYAYKIPEAVSLYKRLVNDEKVVLINGWGTGDTLRTVFETNVHGAFWCCREAVPCT